jgi:PAS domain S-box-containing protein
MKQLQALFSLATDMLCVTDPDGRFLLSNPAFTRALGWSADELSATSLLDLVHPDDRESTASELRKLGSGEPSIRFENRCRQRDGGYRDLTWTAESDTNTGVVHAVARDVTAARQSLDRLMSDLPGMVYRCRPDDDWTMLYVSAGSLDLTGYTPEALLAPGHPTPASITFPEDCERVRQEVQAAIAENREYEIEYRLRTADGREKLVWERGRAITGENGALILQGFVADITERRMLRSELQQLQKMDALGQLTGGVAHDFNNLLTVVIGNLELMESIVGDHPEMTAHLGEAMEAAWRGVDLSQRLLAFSRKQMLAPEVISVNALIGEMEVLLRRTLGAGINIEVSPADGLPQVRVDPGQLENAILNLAINARDAMPNGGTMRIRTGQFKADRRYADARPDVEPGRYVMIEVADTGIGMTPDIRERAFEPFFTTKERGKGTGLGLSMVYGLLKQSGGHARVYSEPGHGTSVKLFLPETEPDV